ncbi:angiotensin-converting enzyme-like [Cotesia glomerata]|nr:angiotensin-converting enzyme-like [Cotesia glomerata]
MNLKWCYAILSVIIYANAFEDVLSENGNPDKELNVSLQFTGFEYEDACFKSAESEWTFIKNPTNQTLKPWEDSLTAYGSIKRKCVKDFDERINETLSSPDIEYKLNLVSKPGDALLEPQDWTSFISFVSEAELIRLSGNYTSGSNNSLRKKAEDSLVRNASAEDKLKAWRSWHETLQPLTTKLSNNLQLVQKAAIANGANDVTEYWEILNEYKNGYNEAKDKWSEISFLYDKIVKFVKTRLTLRYKDLIKGEGIPAHLLGTLQGYDWTPLTMDIVPHPDFIFEIRKNLWQKNLIGKNLYKSASRLASITLKHVPEAQFFDKSNFQGQCPSHLVNFCRQGRLRVNTCSEPSISNYLSAHKNIAKVLIHQMSEESMPIVNGANRYSALEEGVSELFGILASSQAWLTTLNLINETDKTEEAHLVSIMMTALDVLPRMAYYFTADQWRIDVIKNNTFDPENLMSSWWKYRLDYEHVVPGSSENLPTFLDDSFITSNRPYLSKFMGTIIGFQIYEYLMESTEVRSEKLEKIPINHNFIKMIQHGSAENWNQAMKSYLQLYDVSVDSLLSYFSPLEQYLDELDEEEVGSLPVELEKKLEALEDQYQRDLNTPSTTEAIKPTTAMPKKATTKSHKQNERPLSTEAPKPQANNSSKIITDKNSGKEVAKTTEAPVNVKKGDGSVKREDNKGIEEEVEHNNEAGKLIKGGMSTAVWAVGSVLIATIAIVFIAIFGRRRCRKTPKNRRYV